MSFGIPYILNTVAIAILIVFICIMCYCISKQRKQWKRTQQQSQETLVRYRKKYQQSSVFMQPLHRNHRLKRSFSFPMGTIKPVKPGRRIAIV